MDDNRKKKEVQEMMKKLCDILIIFAVLSLMMGIISRLLGYPIVFGIESQAYLQFTHGLLLFAIAIGIRELVFFKKEGK